METELAILASSGARAKFKSAAAAEMLADYCDRARRYVPLRIERFASEEKFFSAHSRTGPNRRTARLVLLDSRGKLWSSEAFAGWVGKQRDEGIQQLVFAIGPADGWSAHAYEKADLLLSLGPMTFPHELAAVVLAEQIYRAFTILEGHPYHLGHRILG